MIGPTIRALFAVSVGALLVLVGCGERRIEPAPDRSAIPAVLGTNLRDVTYWSAEWMFVDGFRHASPFFSQPREPDGRWTIDTPLELGPHGFPARLGPEQAAGVLIYRNDGRYPTGRYTCLHEGRGKLRVRLDGRAVSTEPGRFVFDVAETTEAGIHLQIVETDPADPIRRIRVYLPGFDDRSPPFHPLFLERLRVYDVVRFMDTTQTNDSAAERWADRVTPDSPTQAGPRGVAIEHLVDLCNTLGTDPWFCVPHRATDDYVREFARLVHARLGPSRRVYVEYSNECWNPMFGQTAYCREQGIALDLAGDPRLAGLRFYAKRAGEIHAIWRSAFREEPTRVIRVLSGQGANPSTAEEILDYDGAYRRADAYGIAPYLALAEAALADRATAALDVDAVLAQARSTLDDNAKVIARNASIARARGLPLVAYKGGQHLVGVGEAKNDERLTALFIRANRDPRMESLYHDYFAHWTRAGGGLFLHYLHVCRFSKWGSWGALEWQGQPVSTAPKYRALAAIAAAWNAKRE